MAKMRDRHMTKGLICWLADTVGAILFALGLALFVAPLASGQDAMGQMAPWLAALLGGAMLRAASQYLAAQDGQRVAAEAKAAIRAPLLSRLLGLSPARHAMLGEAMADATDRVEDLHGYHARFLPLRRAAILSPLIVAVAAAFASPVAAAIMLATLPPFAIGMALAGIAAGRAARAQLDLLGRLSGLFVDRVRALPVILGFGAQDRIVRQLAATTGEVAERTIAVLRVAFLSGAVLEFFAALSVALVAVYCGFNLLGLLPFPAPERLSLAQALFVLALAPEFYLPLRRLAAAYHDKQLGEAARERLAASTIAASPENPTGPTGMALLTQPPAILFDEVVIAHQDRDIGPFSFHAPAGQVTALTGPTGVGKSSLLHALLGLATIRSGAILVDGEPLPDGGLRGSASWAGQGVALIPASIADNIRLAAPAAGDAALQAAIEESGLAPLIASRDDGAGAMLDASGSGLSGGERRRIGIARALLRDAPLWLLDEPTADLDETMAAAVMARIIAASRGRTLLMVTHIDAFAELADHRAQLA